MSGLWTPLGIAKLKRLAANGGTYDDAMRVFGRSRSVICEKARKHGIEFRGNCRNPSDWSIHVLSPPPEAQAEGHLRDLMKQRTAAIIAAAERAYSRSLDRRAA